MKRISKGRFSLYLDYYPPVRNVKTGRNSRREFLGIYIFENPREKYQHDYNRTMMNTAELVRCKRVLAIAERDFGFTVRGGQDNFLEYFKRKMEKGHNYSTWHNTYEYLIRYTGGICTFSDLTVDYCQGFLEYMLTNPVKLKSGHLKASTANNYMDKFRCVLRMAYKENYIKEDIGGLVPNVKSVKVRRMHLGVDELKRLASAPCEDTVLKAASLFSCLTGLRFSDVSRLSWDNIYKDKNGGYYMHIVTKKTETDAYLPIGKEAMKLCGKRTDGLVFEGLKYSSVKKFLPRWLKAAGIDKHITFHSFRHTYATLQLAAGTDIYTISRLLTHSNIATTQVYTDVIDKVKRKAADKISLE